ncbi:MAG TPA: DMT family transporter [Homoserinimonas sp.]|nr:DMT family transporter [Homoserinimonas sp.]
MLEDLTDLTESLTPLALLGIPIALVGAVFLAVGAQLQHRGVGKVDAHSRALQNVDGLTPPVQSTAGLSMNQLLALARRPSWLVGTLLLGLAIVAQLTSLGLSPITLVQPLGAVALVITAIMNARLTGLKIDPLSIRAILLCVLGVAIFVTLAAFTTTSRPVSDAQLIIILSVLAGVTAAFAVLFAAYRRRFKAIMYIIGAGVLYGFVATLAKVVIDRTKTGDFFDVLTLVCVGALLLGTVLGGYFVQNAYASGPPALVIAGLTVIDPLVAVSIGIVVLNEAAGAPLFAVIGFVVAGIVAIYGVFELSKHHPQTRH